MHVDDEYLEAKVMTAPPHQLHLMVVDGAIRHATLAQQALAQDDIEAAHLSLGTTRDFVSELISGLNAEQAPELVDSLKALFVFVFRKLVDADVQHDPQLVEDALSVLRQHRAAWSALGEKLQQEQVTTAEPAATNTTSWTT